MNIFYIGSTNEYGTKICNYLSGSHNVVMFSSKSQRYELDCEFKNLNLLANAGDVDLIIYDEEDYTELNLLLDFATEHAKYFIDIKQDRFADVSASAEDISKLLCEKYQGKGCLEKVFIITASELYGEEIVPTYVEAMVRNTIKTNKIVSPYSAESSYDNLHVEDFCLFLEKFIESIDTCNEQNINALSGYPFKFVEVLEKLNAKYPQAEVVKDSDKKVELQSRYELESWSPKHSFLNDFDFVVDNVNDKLKLELKQKRQERLGKLWNIGAFILMFLAMEFYCDFIHVASDLQYVDVRLLFVVASSLLFNRKYAFTSVFLAGISNAIQCLRAGIRWYVIFYNVDNWIPVVIYLVVAILITEFMSKYSRRQKCA